MSDTKTIRVWIADDEELIRRSIRRTLASRNDLILVGESASGKETIAALRTSVLDLLLLDVQMHEGTGFDVVTEVGPRPCPRSFSSPPSISTP